MLGSKVMKVRVKSLKNAPEQHVYGSKTTENACIKCEHALISLNLYYYIHCSSFCDEGKR